MLRPRRRACIADARALQELGTAEKSKGLGIAPRHAPSSLCCADIAITEGLGIAEEPAGASSLGLWVDMALRLEAAARPRRVISAEPSSSPQPIPALRPVAWPL